MSQRREFPFERDPVIEAYEAGIDRTLLRENLRETVDERLQALQAMMDLYAELQQSRKGARMPRSSAQEGGEPA